MVRIPYVLAPGDSTSGPILRAEVTLRSNPAVEMALLIDSSAVSHHYRRPKDGAGFTSWILNKDSASGVNWALVGINAPLAWGCETGTGTQPSVPIAVVDEGFFNVPDLDSNVGVVRQYDLPSNPKFPHGTAVASVIGAVGDNQKGITGMLWKANLQLYDDSRKPPSGVKGGLAATSYFAGVAAKTGARVVNISSGLDTSNFHYRPIGARKSDSALVFRTAFNFTKHILNSRAPGSSQIGSLFVVAAGNEQFSAYFNGLSYASHFSSVATNVITVGATTVDRFGNQSLASFSNSDSLVDVVAPNEGMTVLGKGGTSIVVSGTSFSAPLVAGIAGMLVEFDPTIPASALKQLIIQGAIAGGRSVADPRRPNRRIPIVDAYATLRLAASKMTSPLSGNRVYDHGSSLVIERGASTEVLGPVPLDFRELNAKHGGRRVEVYAYPSSYAYTYDATNRNWTTTSIAPFPPTAAGDGGRTTAHST